MPLQRNISQISCQKSKKHQTVNEVTCLKYIEYGKQNHDVIILLHGGGLSWWNYREAARMLQADYHVILPILDGHAESDRTFTNIEDNAKEIIEFIDKQFGGSVLLIGGLSLGGQILLEILSQRKNVCQYALVESVLVIPSKFTYSMIKPVFGNCYGLIKRRWFSKLQFKSLRMKQNLFEDYFCDSCSIAKSNLIAFLQANALYSIKPSIAECSTKAYIFVGVKENKNMRKSAEIIHQNLLGSKLQVLPEMYHGEFSINHAEEYVRKILEIIEER